MFSVHHSPVRLGRDKTVELDLLAPDPEQADGLLAGEVKWRRLSPSDHAAILRDLRDRWHRSALAARHPAVLRFVVLDSSAITAPVR